MERASSLRLELPRLDLGVLTEASATTLDGASFAVEKSRASEVNRRKAGKALRHKWLRIDPNGTISPLHRSKYSLTHRLGVQIRDLRLLDAAPATSPPALLCRDKAIVANLEFLKCIITTDYLLIMDSGEERGRAAVAELQRRLQDAARPGDSDSDAGRPQMLSFLTATAAAEDAEADALAEPFEKDPISVSELHTDDPAHAAAPSSSNGEEEEPPRLSSAASSSDSGAAGAPGDAAPRRAHPPPNTRAAPFSSLQHASKSSPALGAALAPTATSGKPPTSPFSSARPPLSALAGRIAKLDPRKKQNARRAAAAESAKAAEKQKPKQPDGMESMVAAARALPFELRVLECVLDFVSMYLEALAMDLEAAAHPALDAITEKTTAGRLDRVRSIKTRLVRLNTRVQTIREVLEKLLDDDDDMKDMNLSAKARNAKRLAEWRAQHGADFSFSSLYSGSPGAGGSGGSGGSAANPIETLPAPTQTSAESGPIPEEQEAAAQGQDGEEVGTPAPSGRRSFDWLPSGRGSFKGTPAPFALQFPPDHGATDEDDKDEVEDLLEAYFMNLDNTFNKLQTLQEYIDDTEEYVRFDIDTRRNQFIEYRILIVMGTFACHLVANAANLLTTNTGLNLAFRSSFATFMWTTGLSVAGTGAVIVAFVWYCRAKRILCY